MPCSWSLSGIWPQGMPIIRCRTSVQSLAVCKAPISRYFFRLVGQLLRATGGTLRITLRNKSIKHVHVSRDSRTFHIMPCFSIASFDGPLNIRNNNQHISPRTISGSFQGNCGNSRLLISLFGQNVESTLSRPSRTNTDQEATLPRCTLNILEVVTCIPPYFSLNVPQFLWHSLTVENLTTLHQSPINSPSLLSNALETLLWRCLRF